MINTGNFPNYNNYLNIEALIFTQLIFITVVNQLVLPGITREQMIQVDRLMEQRGISLLLMMENAGLNLARLAFLMSKPTTSYIVIAGSGGNAGGGMVAARRLAAWGCKVDIFLPV